MSCGARQGGADPWRQRLYLGVGNQPVVPVDQAAGDRCGNHGSPQDDHRWRIAERRQSQCRLNRLTPILSRHRKHSASRMTNSPFDARCSHLMRWEVWSWWSRAQQAELGARSRGCSRGLARMSCWWAAIKPRMTQRALKVSSYAVDIRDPDAVRALFDAIWKARGRVDSLINSAGGQFPQSAIDISVKGWNAVINTNLNGTWYMMQAAAQHWRDAGHPGSIVNIVVVTTHGLYGIAHSVAARSGVVGLSRSVAVEWAPLNIRVNCVAPGLIETEGWKVYS